MDMEPAGFDHGGMARTGPQKPTSGRTASSGPSPVPYLGKWIYALGRRPGEVAKAAKVNEGYLSELIAGKAKKNPSYTWLKKVADEIGCRVDDFGRPPPDKFVIRQIRGLDPATLSRLVPDDENSES
jgi:hypothetical protein